MEKEVQNCQSIPWKKKKAWKTQACSDDTKRTNRYNIYVDENREQCNDTASHKCNNQERKKKEQQMYEKCKKKITYEDIDQNAGVKISLRKYVNKCIEIIKKVYGSKSHVNQ